MTSDAQKRANAKYQIKNTKVFGLRLNKNTDAELIAKLESVDNVQGYIKDLIRKDIE